MQSQMELSLFLVEMSEEQRHPWDKSCGADHTSKCHQERVLDAVHGPRAFQRIVEKGEGSEGGLHGVREGPCAAVPCEPGAQLAEEHPLCHFLVFQLLQEGVEPYIRYSRQKSLAKSGNPDQELNTVFPQKMQNLVNTGEDEGVSVASQSLRPFPGQITITENHAVCNFEGLPVFIRNKACLH